MWIERLSKITIQKALKSFPSLYLAGARQVGKTSLVRHLFPDFDYVSLDVPMLAEQAKESPHLFLSQFSHNLIIDEVHYAPSLFRHLKHVIDQNQRDTNYILTGSQHFLMMSGIQESLAGRCAILSLNPLTQFELKNYSDRVPSLILNGGYPELWSTPDLDSSLWFSSYIATYLERDVRNIITVSSLRDFDRFLRSCAFRNAQLLHFSDLSKDIGVAVSTVREWMSVLQQSCQVSLVEPYFRNLGKRLVKTPKLYFLDTGLVCHLNGITSETHLYHSPQKGALWESLVYHHLKTYLEDKHKIWFWRTSVGDEIDFLLDLGGKYILIECKYKETVDSGDLKPMKVFAKQLGAESILESVIVAPTPHPYPVEQVSVIGLNELYSFIQKYK